jgi:hypothetical protein
VELKALGASEVHWDKRPADADYVILADPEGNRFCVVDINAQPPSGSCVRLTPNLRGSAERRSQADVG